MFINTTEYSHQLSIFDGRGMELLHDISKEKSLLFSLLIIINAGHFLLIKPHLDIAQISHNISRFNTAI